MTYGSLADRVEIGPGVAMPRLGIGTYKVSGRDVRTEVSYALEVGYRGIDTASLYDNEEGVGEAVCASGVPREEIFIATKVWNDEQGPGTYGAFEASLERLGLDYVDLYLIHWPIPDLTRETWRAMERVRASGGARAIGVCNFQRHHLDELLSFADEPPAVDQVEHHPWLQQPDLRDYLRDHGITLQAWAPLMRGRAAMVPEMADIARRHGRTASQVSLRWTLQHGGTAVPKSVHPERIRENADVFGFELTAEEMAVIDSLDRGFRLGPDPDQVAARRGL